MPPRQVFERAKHRCEYCQTQGRLILVLEVDHIHPQSKGGTDNPDNLCAACPLCNGHKYNHETGFDPETQSEQPLFNPRLQDWSEHFTWSNDYSQVVGVSAIGRATVERLKMNDQTVQNARRLWASVGWHPPK